MQQRQLNNWVQATRSNRICGQFFVFLALFSLALSCVHLCCGPWGLASLALPGVLFFGLIGWWGGKMERAKGFEPSTLTLAT
jgi:hypothetical protein